MFYGSLAIEGYEHRRIPIKTMYFHLFVNEIHKIPPFWYTFVTVLIFLRKIFKNRGSVRVA